MPTRLFLVRHGETEWSRSGRHTSITDLPLTETGQRLARALMGHLLPQDFQLVLSSPRRRARETAELAGFIGEYEPQIASDLAEWFYGDYEGKTSKEIWNTVPGWTIWNGEVPGGETAAQVASRLDRVVDRVRGSGVDRAICFGHGHALRALTMRWLGFDLGRGVQFRWTPARSRYWAKKKRSPPWNGGTPGRKAAPVLANRPATSLEGSFRRL
jgi:probable phosphoglycerate mutase